MTGLPAGTWYKPRERFMLDGTPWSTDGYIAIAADAVAPERDRSARLAVILSACMPERLGGWVRADNAVFQACFIDLIEAVHGTALRWLLTPTENGRGALAAFCEGGRPVAAVMPINPTNKEPACPWCNGTGTAEMCAACDGDGQTECKCTCGDEHTRVCEKCSGGRGFGTCPRCKGTKVYQRAAKTAEGELA